MVEDIVPGKKKKNSHDFFNPLGQLFRTIARKSEKKVQNRDTLECMYTGFNCIIQYNYITHYA